MKRKTHLLRIVVSVYNEAESLLAIYEALDIVSKSIKIRYHCEFLFVDDGSTDSSLIILKLLHQHDRRVKYLHFSANFGHEAAMIAGIDHSTSATAVICLDADLQHPPSLIPTMLQAYENGHDIVHMVQADRRESLIKIVFSRIFYGLINLISDKSFDDNASDFFLISQRVAQLLHVKYREKSRFIRGLLQILGFSRSTILFNAPPRTQGNSKYNFYRLSALSLIAFTSFSRAPLHLSLIITIGMSFLSVVLLFCSIWLYIVSGIVSYQLLVVMGISIAFSLQFVVLSIMSEYIGHILVENKRRPIYLIESSEE